MLATRDRMRKFGVNFGIRLKKESRAGLYVGSRTSSLSLMFFAGNAWRWNQPVTRFGGVPPENLQNSTSSGAQPASLRVPTIFWPVRSLMTAWRLAGLLLQRM